VPVVRVRIRSSSSLLPSLSRRKLQIYRTLNIALRNFTISNTDFVKIGLKTLASCETCH
jgi:hypothetical protein